MNKLVKRVIDFQNRCDESNCDYDGILEQWKANDKFYILDGHGMLYITDLQKWQTRNNFFETAYDWVQCRMYDLAKNVLRDDEISLSENEINFILYNSPFDNI